MYNLMFLAFAAAQAALFIWLLRLWRETRAPAAAVLLVPQFFLVWDNLRVASGVVLGHGRSEEHTSCSATVRCSIGCRGPLSGRIG